MIRRALLTIAVVGLTIPAVAISPTRAQSAPAWLTAVNAYRTNVGLPPVADNPAWTQGLIEHSTYILGTGIPGHTQDPAVKGATEAGALAAKNSVVNAWSPSFPKTDTQVIDEWARAPFHAIHYFEPRWQQTAFGSARESGRLPVEGAAALDVIRGYGPVVKIDRPITFPGDGTSVPVSTFTAEQPDPLSSCPGYVAPAGLPLMVMFPSPVSGAAAEVKANGTVAASCVIDSNYVNSDANGQATGRKLLSLKNAILIIPKAPLQPGVEYQVSVTSSQAPLQWKFTIDLSKAPTATANPIVVSAPPAPTAAPKPTSTAAATTTGSTGSTASSTSAGASAKATNSTANKSSAATSVKKTSKAKATKKPKRK